MGEEKDREKVRELNANTSDTCMCIYIYRLILFTSFEIECTHTYVMRK